MPEVWFAVPGDPDTLTGGYLYARRLATALPAAGWTVRPLRLPDGFPDPSEATLAATDRLFAGVPRGAVVLADGLAFGALPAGLLRRHDLRWVALVHHPLALETGLPPMRQRALRASERAALALARRVIATGPHTARTLVADYGVPADRLTVAVPGTDPAPRAVGSPVPQLLTLATLTPRKAHDVLVGALARLTDLAWTSLLVGSAERAPETADAVRSLIGRHCLEGRVRIVGELDEAALQAAWQATDLFVLPSRHEGFGMAFAEALARGIPVVACAAGAVPDTVPAGAGLLVPVDDEAALAEALRRLLADGALRRQMADAAWSHAASLDRWPDTAARVAGALARVEGARVEGEG